MYWDQKKARHHSQAGNRPVLTSYDSGFEHSCEHWAAVRKLVEKDQNATLAENLIRDRAYQLYEQRGKEDGYDLDDWLQAEAEVTQMTRTAAA